MSESIVVAKELSREFGDFLAVDSVSLDVKKGEVFGFLGPNGAGKTTTIKMLTGLLKPTSGRALVGGLDVATDPYAIREQVGYMSQLFSLYPDLTVTQNISFFVDLYGVDAQSREERVEYALSVSNLRESATRLTGLLPLGFRQRLALACAVLHDPGVIFLDEPTSGVDPATRRSFWDLIGRFTDNGTTVFVSTHYLEEAEYCDRVALMNRGRLIALDKPEQLRKAFTGQVFSIITKRPLEAATFAGELPGIAEASLFGRSVRVAAVDTSINESWLARKIETRGIEVEAVTRVAASLEDVFVEHVRSAGGAVVG